MDNIRIRTHKDLSDVKERFYGFTFRQWISIVVTGIIVVPVYSYLKPVLGKELTSWIVLGIGFPFMAWGFFSLQNLTIDKLLRYWKRHYIDFDKPLQYKTEKELQEEKEAKKAKKSKKEKRSKKSIDKESSKSTRAMKKQQKIEKKQAKKIQKKQEHERRIEEKQKAKELRIERKQMKELAKAKKRFGEKIIYDDSQNDMSNPAESLTAEDIQNIIQLGKKAEVIQVQLEQKKGDVGFNDHEEKEDERKK